MSTAHLIGGLLKLRIINYKLKINKFLQLRGIFEVHTKIDRKKEDNYKGQFRYPKDWAVSLKWFHGKLF